MKQRKSIIMIVMLLFASCIMSSCQSEEKKYAAMGMTFKKLNEYRTGKYFYEALNEDENSYLCIVDGQTVNQDSLSVPATFKRKKVIAVTSEGSNATLQTLSLPEDLEYVYNGFGSFTALKAIEFPKSSLRIYDSFAKCTALESLAFPGPVVEIRNASFDDCTALKDLDFQDTVDRIYDSFRGCDALEKVIVPPKTKLTEWGDSNAFSDKTKILQGDRDIIAFSEQYIDSEKIKAQAKTHLAETFDEKLYQWPQKMYDYRKQVNGPIVTMDRCPDCTDDAYGKGKLPKTLALSTVEVYTAHNDYPYTLYTEDKAEDIKNGEPIIYCFAEMIGYSAGPKYFFGGTNVGSYLHYRFSVWDFSANKLLAWSTIKTGYAPGKFTMGKDKITFSVKFGETGKKDFFLEEDQSEPTALYVVEKYIFKKERKTDETSTEN